MNNLGFSLVSALHTIWELKERMEEAHEKVRQNTRTAMLRQKRYHDLKLSWQKFENGDEAYVYFPVRKTGHSSKLTSLHHSSLEKN
jgi:hypothetical protein